MGFATSSSCLLIFNLELHLELHTLLHLSLKGSLMCKLGSFLSAFSIDYRGARVNVSAAQGAGDRVIFNFKILLGFDRISLLPIRSCVVEIQGKRFTMVGYATDKDANL